MNVFLYGVGFTSCCVELVFLVQVQFAKYGGGGIEILSWSIFYTLLFLFVYYSYAVLIQNDEKEISKVTLYLPFMIFIFSLISIILETMNSHPPIAGVFLLLFGLYFAGCLISKKIRISLRGFAWSLFLPMFILLWYTVLTTPFL
ncbi:hypothetical protein MsAg5_17670 [Methanosarcinaceae archaeon Ag5]|uniref:Uncharacterized protein n=2 Tax=Methanolapillus africanus TaxID=3028297 RepID=A0AAE4SG04_9EURY|nr:hypothetical protein [Methanosarcinaceae archaeon Ag5]